MFDGSIDLVHISANSVNTDPIFWSMINAIKELSAKVEELKVKLSYK